MSSDVLAALGAFLSGMGSVLSAVWYVNRARKHYEEECQERLRAFREGLHEMEKEEA